MNNAYSAELDGVVSVENRDNDVPVQFTIWSERSNKYPEIPDDWSALYDQDRTVIKDSLEQKNKDTGYIIFSRPYSDLIYLNTKPGEFDITQSLTAFVSLNEYEPITFSIYALVDLIDMKIVISDLIDNDGHIFPKKNIDVRTVGFIRNVVNQKKKQYILSPFTLEKEAVTIKANTTRQFWLTLKVPPDMTPGNYRGKLCLRPMNVTERILDINVYIFPFRLENSPVVRFMWMPKKLQFQGNRQKMFIDMREHGMTTLIIQGSVKTRNNTMQPEDIDKIVKELDEGFSYHKKYKFRDNLIGGINNNQIIYYWDKKLKWFKFWPITEKRKSEFLQTYKKVFLEYGSEHDWPEILHYVVDEPGGMYPENIFPASIYLNLLKSEYPFLKTFVTIGGGTKQGYDEFGLLGPYLDVMVTNYLTEDMTRKAKQKGKKLWIYNNGSFGNGEPLLDRFFFGYYTWMTGAEGVGQWVYSDVNMFEALFRSAPGYVLETDQGFLPSIYWEMVREGIDDLNYVYTLESLIKKRMLSGDKEQKNMAARAELKLQDIKNKLNASIEKGRKKLEREHIKLTPEDFTYFRREIAEGIQSLF
jgi:hypothetical protein